jgi:hypothetical protein
MNIKILLLLQFSTLSCRRTQVRVVPNKRMWAPQAPSIKQCEIRKFMNACVNVGCDCNVFKDVRKKKMYVYVSPCDSMLMLFSRDVYLCGL